MNVQVYLRLDPLLLGRPELSMPALEHVLAKGSVCKSTQVFEAALCEAFGVERQLDWPAAALSWLGEGNDPGDSFWFYADPVSLELQRDHFSLNLPVPVTMEASEATALCALLNAHFNEDGWQFHVAASGQWYMGSRHPFPVTTSSPASAAKRDIRNYLPQGMAAEKLQQLINEIQMLLHEHPINMTREEQNRPVINSLWFSASGHMPLTRVPPRLVWSDHPLAMGLAGWAGRDALPLPADDVLPQEDAILVLDAARHDSELWAKQLSAALGAKKLAQLSFDIFAIDQHLHVVLEPFDMWKFWRKVKPLESYFAW